MATFQAQVQGLTGLTISSSGTNPTEAELTAFLEDGLMDVTNRWLDIHPEDFTQFIRVSGEVTSNGAEKVDRAKIVSVLRESGTNNDWRSCSYIPPEMQSRVTDTSSIHYASKLHPVYTVLEDGSINVFPAAGSDPDAFNNPVGFDGITGDNLAKAAGYSITVGKRDSSGNITNTVDFYHFTVDTNTATTGGISGGGNSCSAGPATLTA